MAGHDHRSHADVSELSKQTNDRIRQLENGTLVIKDVQETDPAQYFCFLKSNKSTTVKDRSTALNLLVHGI
ncbi:unnamed protein product [Protopolystoma xenopodis]|uniref:Ig-like domain-containing protein n=1 Tax=Protopolystoma xenopodis TaxID=117903 RepID=A0A448X129_9PLAT|nr:unnamed protein product [Protopolystoma xenopodis]